MTTMWNRQDIGVLLEKDNLGDAPLDFTWRNVMVHADDIRPEDRVLLDDFNCMVVDDGALHGEEGLPVGTLATLDFGPNTTLEFAEAHPAMLNDPQEIAMRSLQGHTVLIIGFRTRYEVEGG